jgi:hypothetical protein
MRAGPGPANERCFTEQGSYVVPKAWKAGKERRERKRGREEKEWRGTRQCREGAKAKAGDAKVVREWGLVAPVTAICG